MNYLDLAAKIVAMVKSQYPGCENARACFEDSPSFNMETARDLFLALKEYGPDAIKAISATQTGTARDTLAAQQATAPGYAGLQNQITRDYGPEATRLGGVIRDIDQKAATQTEADILGSSAGQALVSGADRYQQQLDPEFYKSRALIGESLNKYLSSYDPNQLSPGEIEQISRGISAREGPMTPSALRTVQNAQTFGNAATQRWQNFGDAVLKASSALPGLKSGLTGFEIATRRPLTSNVGTNRLGSPEGVSATTALNNNFGFANNALNQMNAQYLGQVNKFKSTDERVNAGFSALGDVVGSY